MTRFSRPVQLSWQDDIICEQPLTDGFKWWLQVTVSSGNSNGWLQVVGAIDGCIFRNTFPCFRPIFYIFNFSFRLAAQRSWMFFKNRALKLNHIAMPSGIYVLKKKKSLFCKRWLQPFVGLVPVWREVSFIWRLYATIIRKSNLLAIRVGHYSY